MAFRKETIRQQFTDALSPVLDSGERVVAAGYTVSGPSPWLTGALGIVLMLALGMRYYYVAVTDRRVLLMKASLLTQKPKGLALAFPVAAVKVAAVNPAGVWSNLRLQPPSGKQMRLNFHRIWREEMGQVAKAIESAGRSGGGEPSAPPTVPPPPQQT